MKFTLIYDGDLPASGNKPKPSHASTMRNDFHDQLADLWNHHVILRQLVRTARTIPKPGVAFAAPKEIVWSPSELSDFNYPIPPLREGQTDFCAPIVIRDVGAFVPLVRNSLYLACSLDILFLRHEEPLILMKQGGDLDGRLKTLFDALRMRQDKSQQANVTLRTDPLFVLLEDDILVSDLSIKTGRLLGDRTKNHHAVKLTIDVTIKVLRVFPQNQCLIGG